VGFKKNRVGFFGSFLLQQPCQEVAVCFKKFGYLWFHSFFCFILLLKYRNSFVFVYKNTQIVNVKIVNFNRMIHFSAFPVLIILPSTFATFVSLWSTTKNLATAVH